MLAKTPMVNNMLNAASRVAPESCEPDKYTPNNHIYEQNRTALLVSPAALTITTERKSIHFFLGLVKDGIGRGLGSIIRGIS